MGDGTEHAKILAYDVESLRGPGDFVPAGADIKAGWDHREEFGVALAVTCDIYTNEFKVYREADVPQLIKDLEAADGVVTWNGDTFDFPILKLYNHGVLPKIKSIDMMSQVVKVMGHRYSLSNAAKANLGRDKTSKGDQSLIWVRAGEWDKVEAYCKVDVELTRDLYLKVVEKKGMWISSNYGPSKWMPW